MANALLALGLISTTVRAYVLCANPNDPDYPPRVRACAGRIVVEEDLDEDGDDLRCPECDRAVRPVRFGKQRHEELRSRVDHEGVTRLVRDQAAKLGKDVRDIARGVLRVDLGDNGVFVCVLDYCAEDDVRRARDWAVTNPTCYVTVNSQHADIRFLPESWLTKVTLADMVVGAVDLAGELRRLADMGRPPGLVNASVPVYAKTVPAIVPVHTRTQGPARRFVVEVGERAIRVDGVDVVAPQARRRVPVFRILWKQFLGDIASGRAPDEFTALKLPAIVKILDRESGKPEAEDATDTESLRRVINNLQADIEKVVNRELGGPIDREDVIQTCRWTGTDDTDYGYRINPFTVCARPFEAPSA